MTRAQVLYSTRDHRYRVIDTRFDHLVLFTSNYSIADYWRGRVNLCEHDIPFDLSLIHI